MECKKKTVKEKSLFMLGMQFTSMMVAPPVFLILGAMYLQKKCGYGDGIMVLAVVLSMLCMLANMYSFVKSAILLTENSEKGKSDERENSDKD